MFETSAKMIRSIAQQQLRESLIAARFLQPMNCDVTVDDNHLFLPSAFSALGQPKAKYSPILVKSDIAHFKMIQLTSSRHATLGVLQPHRV